jgi:glycosyltransferase involved in cell wall biosynthesis
MFGWEFPPHNSGGLGTACYGLTKALATAKTKIIFVLPKELPGLHHNFLDIRFANLEKIKFSRVGVLLHPYVTSSSYLEELERTGKVGMYGLHLFEEVKRYGDLARALAKREQFDVIHAHDWLSFAAGVAAKEVSGKPLIVHVHATEFDRTAGHPNQHIYDAERKGMHAADCIIAVSHHTKNTIVQHYGISPDKVSVVHNGIDIDEHVATIDDALRWIRDAGKQIVLFVGRITIQKGPDYFVKAARRVLDVNPNVMFVVSGSGDMEGQMIRLASEMGISDRFFFTGFLRGNELLRLYRAADLFVMPSVSEPFGITPLEALANHTPVLISKQSGVAEVLPNALKSDFWDTDDMADKILTVLRERHLHQALKEYGHEDARRATWEEAAGKCMVLYEQIAR